jgi:hypothetical protein
MQTLTIEQFNTFLPGRVFASGILPNSPDGLFMTNELIDKELRWVAKKGNINDWAIYCHWSDKSVEWIMNYGDKVCSETNIKRCVPCDDEVFKQYRF